MKTLLLALFFLAGGIASELRSPVRCETLPTRHERRVARREH